ncbi:MAG: hypothetical protein QM493_02075 [Sulfurovum sp.]
MQIVINNPSLEESLIAKSKKLKIKLDELIETILNDKIKADREFKIDEEYLLNSLENIKQGNKKEFKKMTPNELFDSIGI